MFSGERVPVAEFDAMVVVPTSATARIRESHITMGHKACKALEERPGLI